MLRIKTMVWAQYSSGTEEAVARKPQSAKWSPGNNVVLVQQIVELELLYN